MKTEIVIICDKEPRAGTFLIAKGFERQHKHLLELINRYKEDFEDFGRLKRQKITTKGRPIEEYLLNENQTLLLGTYLRNSKIIRSFKKKIIHEFDNLKKQNEALKNVKKDPVYQITRDAGKLVRRETTDVMKEFVAYATDQGSTNASRYYSNITRMMNGILFIVEKKYKNLRKVMSIPQLMTVSSADQIVNNGLKYGMSKKMFYKDIYKEVKSRIVQFAELHGQSKIIDDYLHFRR